MLIESFSADRGIVIEQDSLEKSAWVQNEEKIRGMEMTDLSVAKNVVVLWAEKVKMTKAEMGRAVEHGLKVFNEAEIDRSNPQADLAYWIASGTVDRRELGAAIWNEKKTRRFDISADKAREYAKMENKDTASLDQEMSAMVLTLAKIEAVKPMMEDVYPALEWKAVEETQKIMEAMVDEMAKGNKIALREGSQIWIPTLNRRFTLTALTLLTISAILLSACGTSAQTGTATSETQGGQVTETASATETQPATETATATPDPIVHEGSEAALAGIPENSVFDPETGNFTFTNKAGEEMVVGKMTADGKVETEEFLKYTLSTTREESKTSTSSKVPYEGAAKITSMLGRLNGEAFGPDVLACKKGDVIKVKAFSHFDFRWSGNKMTYFSDHPEALPAKVVGYFTSDYEGETLYGRVVEWLTEDGEIVYITYINTNTDLAHLGIPEDQAIFPSGLLNRGINSNDIHPSIDIMANKEINDQLVIWEATGNPPADLEQNVLFGALGLN